MSSDAGGKRRGGRHESMRHSVGLAGAAWGRSGSPNGPLPQNDPSCPAFIDTHEIMSSDSAEATVLNTTWIFGRRVLMALASLMLAATVMACRSSSSGTEGNSPDWGSFVAVPDSEYPTPTASIEEMERVGGFPFIFPSYLPEGLERKIVLAAWAQTVSTFDGVRKIGGPGEEVAIYPTRLDLPYISIVERMAPFPESFPRSSADVEHINIGNIEVACETHSPSNDDRLPVMQCDWLTGEIGVSILFSWDLERAIPGLITQEMRQEAMKVVESMILAPEHP